jgi:hypothetical protein
MINGAKEIKTAFITLLPIFLCACYRSSAPVVSDGSIEETGRENPAEADGREEDPNPDDPEIVDGAPDFPPVCPEGLADCAGLCVDLSSPIGSAGPGPASSNARKGFDHATGPASTSRRTRSIAADVITYVPTGPTRSPSAPKASVV